jgi:hypothetical protein
LCKSWRRWDPQCTCGEGDETGTRRGRDGERGRGGEGERWQGRDEREGERGRGKRWKDGRCREMAGQGCKTCGEMRVRKSPRRAPVRAPPARTITSEHGFGCSPATPRARARPQVFTRHPSCSCACLPVLVLVESSRPNNTLPQTETPTVPRPPTHTLNDMIVSPPPPTILTTHRGAPRPPPQVLTQVISLSHDLPEDPEDHPPHPPLRTLLSRTLTPPPHRERTT